MSILKKIKLIPKWFSEYFLFCSRRSRYRNDEDDFLIIGHRGSPAKECENTIKSFEQALADGANGLEIDLSITKDGEVIIWHDWNPNGTDALLREAGFEPFIRHKPHPPAVTSPYRRKISELTLQEVREHFDYKERHTGIAAKAYIPTLEEFFEWSRKKRQLSFVFLDIKTPESEAELSLKILECIHRLSGKYNPTFRLVLETNSLKILEVMKEAYPDFNYSLDIEPPLGLILDPSEYSAVQAAIDHHISTAIALRPRKITIANWTTYRRIIRYDLKLRALHNKNNPDRKVDKLIGATVSKTRELKCLVKLGIGGLQTDFPDRLYKIVENTKKKKRSGTKAA